MSADEAVPTIGLSSENEFAVFTNASENEPTVFANAMDDGKDFSVQGEGSDPVSIVAC